MPLIYKKDLWFMYLIDLNFTFVRCVCGKYVVINCVISVRHANFLAVEFVEGLYGKNIVKIRTTKNRNRTTHNGLYSPPGLYSDP